MIVNYTEKGWQIITQRSHGLLAAQICAQWQEKDRPQRWIETLTATAEHDDVFNEFEDNDLLDENGAPLDFKLSEFELEKSQCLIDMAETKSAYNALLISRHIHFVHGSNPRSKTFLKKLRSQEKQWLKVAETTELEVLKSYELLEFCDAFSLLLCQGLIQPEGRKIEISNGPDHKSYEMYQKGDCLIVTPWPFVKSSFQVSYETRTIQQLSFGTAKELQTSIKATKVVTQRITLAKV